MVLDPERVETVLIDSYSTIVDMRSMEDHLAAYTDRAREVARLWFQRSKVYGAVAARLETFRPCREKYRHALAAALDALDVTVSESEFEEILDGLDRLTVFDDVPEGLRRLTAAGYDVYVLSNGDRDMLETLTTHADVADVVAGTISASEVGLYKPDRRLYRHAAVRAETPISEIAHVTASWSDVLGATAAGMQGVWIDRTSTDWEGFLGDPDCEIETLHELATLLDG